MSEVKQYMPFLAIFCHYRPFCAISGRFGALSFAVSGMIRAESCHYWPFSAAFSRAL
jgi:hypothetical protein